MDKQSGMLETKRNKMQISVASLGTSGRVSSFDSFTHLLGNESLKTPKNTMKLSE